MILVDAKSGEIGWVFRNRKVVLPLVGGIPLEDSLRPVSGARCPRHVEHGSESYGGPVVTAGGVLFIGASVRDKKFRAFDKATGKLLWETLLPFSACATPATYEIDGRQYVVIAAGG
jgi:glucose dehydrogenase